MSAEVVWLPIADYPAYEVSSGGDIRISASGHVMRQKLLPTGYLLIGLVRDHRQKWMLVHRIVAKAFHGEAPSSLHQVAHNNGIRTDNRAANLRWATRQENWDDRRRHGTNILGERNPAAKLTPTAVRDIRRMNADGIDNATIARAFGVTRANIRHIVKGRNWRHV